MRPPHRPQRRNPGLQSASQAPSNNAGAGSSVRQPALLVPTSSLSHTFPPVIALASLRRAGGTSMSLQLPSINAKRWPSNETLITSCSSPHTTKGSVPTWELLSAAAALARGSNYSHVLLGTRDWCQSLRSSSAAPQSFGRGLSLPPWLCVVRERPQVSHWPQTAICFNCRTCQFLYLGKQMTWNYSLLCSCSHWCELQGRGTPAESGKSHYGCQ